MTTVWDPVFGRATAAKPVQTELRDQPLEKLKRFLTIPMVVVACVGFGVAVFSDALRIYGIVAATIPFVFLLLGDKISGAEGNRAARIANAAATAGYLGGSRMPRPKIARLAGRIRNLMVVRLGASIPLDLRHEIWGETKTGVPFWMGLSLNASAAYLGGPKANIPLDKESAQGELAAFVVAYKLDRDTGVRLEVMPEFVTAIGPLDRDIKTESTEFNAKFNIRLTEEDGKKSSQQHATQEVLRILTPATQVVFLGLAEPYAARAIIDGDTVFFGGYRNLQTLDDTALERLLTRAIEDFAQAAVAFKTYAE